MSVRYVSTRGGLESAGFTDVLLAGLAPDGGLVVPEQMPRLDGATMESLRDRPYRDVATEVVTRFIDDLPGEAVKGMVARAYDPADFDHPDIVSMRELEPGVFLAGLSHGPTLAFKDMALRLLGELFEYVLVTRGERLTVLGATSGDTGSSAEHAMIGKEHVDVFMLSPLGRTSPFQAAQMYTLDEPNIFNIAVRGVFDDCQDLVKSINADAPFKAAHNIGAVNSINWARIMAQVAYYLYVWLRSAAPEIDVAVPTGNFGNVYAGYVARRMGVPIRRLIVATNENDVLAEFFASGSYRVRAAGQVVATSSPSMDISKASNFERFVYALHGDDPRTTQALFASLVEGGGFHLTGRPWEAIAATGLVAGSSTHEDRIATIRRIAQGHDVLIDPHTADGVNVGYEMRDETVPLVCLETAQPVKFAATIEEALGHAPPMPERFADLLDRPQHVVELDPDPDAIKAFIASHRHDPARP